MPKTTFKECYLNWMDEVTIELYVNNSTAEHLILPIKDAMLMVNSIISTLEERYTQHQEIKISPVAQALADSTTLHKHCFVNSLLAITENKRPEDNITPRLMMELIVVTSALYELEKDFLISMDGEGDRALTLAQAIEKFKNSCQDITFILKPSIISKTKPIPFYTITFGCNKGEYVIQHYSSDIDGYLAPAQQLIRHMVDHLNFNSD